MGVKRTIEKVRGSAPKTPPKGKAHRHQAKEKR